MVPDELDLAKRPELKRDETVRGVGDCAEPQELAQHDARHEPWSEQPPSARLLIRISRSRGIHGARQLGDSDLRIGRHRPLTLVGFPRATPDGWADSIRRSASRRPQRTEAYR